MVKLLRKDKNAFPISLKNGLQRLAYRLSRTSLPEVMFVATLILVRWYQNSDFQYPSEIFLPLILFSILASAVYYGYKSIFGPGLAAHGAALLLSYGLYSYGHIANYGYVQQILAIIPDGLATPFTKSLIVATLMAVFSGLVGWMAERLSLKYRSLQALQPLKVVLFAVAFLFALQLVRVGNRLAQIDSQVGYRPPAPVLPAPATPVNSQKPDIYYLVFDRYTNVESLKAIYGFDNSPLMDFLKQQGFTNRKEAYSNYPYTMPSIVSTLSMDYLGGLETKFGHTSKWQTGFPYRNILKNPPLLKILKSNGYSYNLLSSWSDYSRIGIKADNRPTQSFRLSVPGKEFYLSDLERDILNKSIFSPWLKKGLTVGSKKIIKYDLDRNPGENFEAQMEALRGLSADGPQSKPQFTFAHILAPHDPYVFDQNGNTPTYDPNRTDNGLDEKQKYLNELVYINKRIMELVAHIRSTSPDSVVVIQSDEGSYPKQFRHELSASNYYDPAKLPVAQMRQKMGILASYYLPGVEKQKLEKLDSSTNTFRLVLNEYLGYDLPMLPACHYASGNKFVIYDFTLITEKLTGRAASPACQQL
ncbi:MAG: sulfatase-like hydrolase/transferase [Candidatus Saccharimonadales bacterium]